MNSESVNNDGRLIETAEMKDIEHSNEAGDALSPVKRASTGFVTSDDDKTAVEVVDSDKLSILKISDPAGSQVAEEKEPLKAWLVLAATFIAMFFSYGTSFSQGVWQRYFFASQTFGPKTQKELAWVGSIGYACSTMLGIVVGPASDAFGHQRMFGIGVTGFSLCWLASSFATEVWILYLTQGLLYGFSISCLYICSGGVLITHWTRRRALAISLAGTGGGVGGFVWPLVIQALLDRVGMAWAYRVMCFVSIAVLGVCAIILRPKGEPAFSAPRKRTTRKFIDPSFFTDKHYYILSMVGFWITWGYYLVNFYLPPFATSHGLTPQQAALMVSLVNLAGLLVRFIQGPLTKLMPTAAMWAAGITAAGVLQLGLWANATNFGLMAAFALLYGTAATGLYHGLYPVVVAECFPDKYASAIGLIYAWCAISGLLSPVICGMLVDRNTFVLDDGTTWINWRPVTWLGGSCMVVAGGVAWLEVWMRRKERKEKERNGRAGEKDEEFAV